MTTIQGGRVNEHSGRWVGIPDLKRLAEENVRWQQSSWRGRDCAIQRAADILRRSVGSNCSRTVRVTQWPDSLRQTERSFALSCVASVDHEKIVNPAPVLPGAAFDFEEFHQGLWVGPECLKS